jgi:DnaJ-domain-containing protein 1
MSLNEVLVVVFGLFIGYWVVSKLFSATPPRTEERRSAEEPQPRQEQRQAEEPPSATDPAWHEVLQLSPRARAEEIKAAYRRLMSQYHPDKVETLGSELRELAERKSKEITAAYREGMRVRGSDA